MSLFAMLMIFVGPLVSQSVPMDHRMGMSMPTSMDMPASMAIEHGGHEAGHSTHGGSELHALWEKCGYCTLFFHCPALPQALSLITVEAPPAATLHRAQPLAGHARQAVFPGARTRAPPQLDRV
nr:DUF2946 domain-containing protein [Pseudomonas sp. R5(2019)]